MPERDSSFTDLIQKINKMNIDDRLKPAFRDAMNKFQKYFNEKGYTSERDFNAFFEEHIFNEDPDKNLKLIVSDEPSKNNAMGFYRWWKEEIHVDEKFLENRELTTHILIHEFIHFLTRAEQAKGDIIPNFMNEGITEKLAREVSGMKEIGSYEPQVRMMDFLNKLRGENYNFRMFMVQGRIDSKLLFLGSFNSESKLFQNKFDQQSMGISSAVKDENYIKAQRSLIFDTLTTAKDIGTYKRIVEALASRPIRDDEFVNQALERAERYLITSECMSFSKNNPDHQMMQTFMANKVKELRDKLTILGQIDPKTPFEFIKDPAGGANIILKKEDGQLKWNILNLQTNSQMTTSQNKVEISYGPKYPYAYKPKCWIYTAHQITHGSINLAGALKGSCNCYFYEVGRRIGIANIVQWAKNFGLGSKTGIELSGEAKGNIAGDGATEWSLGDTLSASIGQNTNLFTPIQLANYISTIANGGTLNKVSLIKNVGDDINSVSLSELASYTKEFTGVDFQTRNLEIDPSYINAIKEGMYAVTTENGGTAADIFADSRVEVAGKTGTAQVASGANNAIFVGFAPYNNPKIAVVAIVEHGGEGYYLANMVKDITNEYFDIYNFDGQKQKMQEIVSNGIDF